MKNYVFVSILLVTPLEVHARQIVLDIPDKDIAIVENDVMDAEQWIKDAWAGKLSKCADRMVQTEVKKSVDANETLPAGKAAVINKAFARPDYENRKVREARIAKDSLAALKEKVAK